MTDNTRISILIAVLKLVFTFAACNLHISSEHLWIHVYVCIVAAKLIFYDSSFFLQQTSNVDGSCGRALNPVEGDRTAAYF